MAPLHSAKGGMHATQTTNGGFTNTPGSGSGTGQNNMSTFANTIIQPRSSNPIDFSGNQNGLRSKFSIVNQMNYGTSGGDENNPHALNQILSNENYIFSN